MSMVVPVDASHDVQTSIRGIIDELGSVQRRIASMSSPEPVTKRDIEELRRAIEAVYQKPTTLDFIDVFRSAGPSHALGYVPDPGADAWGGRVVTEDGWNLPLDGLVRVVTRLGVLGEQQLAGDILNILAHVAIIGNISAANAKFKDVEILGNLIGGYHVLKTWRFSAIGAGNQNVGSAETEIPLYGYTFAANEMKVGDLYHWHGSLAYAANANVKTARVYLGTSANHVVRSGADQQPTVTHYRLQFLVRSATLVAVSGFTTVGQNTGTAVVVQNNAALTVSDITTNAQYLKLTLQGVATADVFATDQQLILLRPRDTASP